MNELRSMTIYKARYTTENEKRNSTYRKEEKKKKLNIRSMKMTRKERKKKP